MSRHSETKTKNSKQTKPIIVGCWALLVCISSLEHSLRVQCAFKWHNNHHKWTSSCLQCPKIVIFMYLTVQRSLLLLLLLLLLLAIASALRTQCPNVVSVTNPPKTQLISNGYISFCVFHRTTMSLLWMNECVVTVNRMDNPLLALAHSLSLVNDIYPGEQLLFNRKNKQFRSCK